MTTHVEVLVIGAGQAGLAASYHLSRRGIEHIVLEGDRVGGAWTARRWDTFRLVTPGWCIRLPGEVGLDIGPDDFISGPEMTATLQRYSSIHSLPVREGVAARRLTQFPYRAFLDRSGDAEIIANHVIVTTGGYQRPHRPASVDGSVYELTSLNYRNPDQVPDGAVLVIGSGQSGTQIAADLVRVGREVYLSTGRCGWVPRRYRGRDIARWLVELGLLERTVDTLPDPKARWTCFPQVSGADGGRDLNVHTLAAAGVILLGRLCTIADGTAWLRPDLRANLKHADRFAKDLKRRIDQHAGPALTDEDDWPSYPRDLGPTTPDLTQLDLRAARVGSVVWACGYRPDFSWIQLPVFDASGLPLHRRGVSECSGLYFLGLPWLHKWKSATLLGIDEDADYVTAHIASRLKKKKKKKGSP